MTFLTVLIAYLLLRWWGSAFPLHHDQWFHRLASKLAEQDFLSDNPSLVFVLSLLVPILAMLLVTALLVNVSPWLEMLVAVPVILYSLGRGRFKRIVLDYISASEAKDWQLAVKQYSILISSTNNVEDDDDSKQDHHKALDQTSYEFADEDWQSLNNAMFSSVCYRAFERVLAVLLWLILIGPVGALLYRLSALYLEGESEKPGSDLAARWLWAIEWPAVRAVGLSFALTGNFVNCIKNWQQCFWDFERPSEEVIRYSCEGGLGVDEQEPEFEDISPRHFKLTLALFSRTIIFWICALAVGSAFF